MNTDELTNILIQDEATALLNPAVKPLDHFDSDLIRKPSMTIINLDPCWEAGSHWVAVYIPLHGKAEYFDSYGFKPNDYIVKTLQHLDQDIIYSSHLLQGFSTVCGQYCLIFLLLRARNYTFNEIMSNMFLCESVSERDTIINMVINNKFSNQLKASLKVLDTTFLQNYQN